jgi:NADPH-dependent 2,4-dienoyl-CoA reductase/sulfur reductase-like enzyme
LQQRFDILVVGGGPGGIAAAVRAAQCGAKVGLVDDNPNLGGQIWRGISASIGEAALWRDKLQATNATILCRTRVFHQPRAGVLLAEQEDGLQVLEYENLILATGARERFLPFPGWTLPNVMGAGGLQAMVKSGLAIDGKRVILAGTGPLLLAVAAYLRQKGAEIVVICEQASIDSLARFSIALMRHPQKIRQALRLRKDISGVPLATISWPVSAEGKNALERVTISRNGKKETIECQYLACGFHLVPNIELPVLLGCQIHDGYVQVDELQQTSVKGIYCAGEPTGISGVESSLAQGEIAGFTAAGRPEEARKLFRAREKGRDLCALLDRTFRLRGELRNILSPETLVCRCEDVPYSRLQKHSSWRAAKLQTRCGMGPCQGRICGPATQFLFDWNPDSTRPPIFPARVDHLAAMLEPELQPTTISGGS